MTSPKVDYQDFADDTTDFIVRLKRVFADINIRIAAVENVKGMVDEFERRYGEFALNRIEAAIAPVLQLILEGLDQSRTTLAELDEFYRTHGMERVDTIIEPLIAAAVDALAEATILRDQLAQFLASKQSVSAKGQPDGYPGLDADGKVPSAQLPAAAALTAGLMSGADKAKLDGIGTGADKTTASTVGAAVANTSADTPTDSDSLAGLKAGGSTLFRLTLGGLKALLKTYFDAIYVPVGRTISATGLATGGGALGANRTITVPKADPATAIAGVDDTMAMTAVRTVDTVNSRKLLITVPLAGAAVDLTAIPAWAKKITISFDQATTNGSSDLYIRLGTSAGVEATGYTGAYAFLGNPSTACGTSTLNIGIYAGGTTTARTHSGNIVLALVDPATNRWAGSGVIATSAQVFPTTASKALAGVLDRIRFTTQAGTAVYNGGTVSLLIE